jgi:uncharacterized membrane protein
MHPDIDPALTGMPPLRRLYLTATSSYVALIVLSVLWEGWLAPARDVPPGLWLTVKTLPLLLPLSGILRGKAYTYGWAGMLVLPYAVEGLVLTYQYRAQGIGLHATLPYALLETVLSLTFALSAAFYIRVRADVLSRKAPPDT